MVQRNYYLTECQTNSVRLIDFSYCSTLMQLIEVFAPYPKRLPIPFIYFSQNNSYLQLSELIYFPAYWEQPGINPLGGK